MRTLSADSKLVTQSLQTVKYVQYIKELKFWQVCLFDNPHLIYSLCITCPLSPHSIQGTILIATDV
jgi:hypothetical protein